ncbi:unnamed protein product [Fusarium fujikuroi]|uniref:Uncharacterized protein n=1 Tax=Fusarium fujikuroi TaxID=5127 RepID=A0A9Q9U7W1_FUSFU|nr:unnamed protein product [Fusarium fujikuroi]
MATIYSRVVNKIYQDRQNCWLNLAAIESNRDIKDFFIKNRIDTNTGLALLIKIAKYLSRKLSLPKGTLIKKIYAWQLLAVIVDIFSAGIYIFISRSLFIYYNKIYLINSIKKEDKFYIIVLAVIDKIPNLLGIYKPILKSFLSSNNIKDLSRDLRVFRV